MSIYDLGSSTDSLQSLYDSNYESDSSSEHELPLEQDAFPTRDTVNPRDSLAGHLTDRLSNWANNSTSCLNNRVTVGLSHTFLAVGGLVETVARPFFAITASIFGLIGVPAAKILSLFTSRVNHVNSLQKWHNQVTAPILAGTVYSGVSTALAARSAYRTFVGESTISQPRELIVKNIKYTYKRDVENPILVKTEYACLLYTSPSPRD